MLATLALGLPFVLLVARSLGHAIDGSRDSGDDSIDSTRRIARERDALRAALELLPDAVAIVDPDRRLLLRNRRYTEWFGDAAASDASDPSHGRASSPEENCETTRQWRVHCVDGQVRDVDYFTAPIRDPNGDPLGRIYSYHDVNREVELIRANSDALSVLSHHLRTPLASVVGFAELLLAREPPTGERRELLQLILEEGWRLASILDESDNPRRDEVTDSNTVSQNIQESTSALDH